MGKPKAKISKKGNSLSTVKKDKQLPSKQKTIQTKENKKLSMIAKSEIKNVEASPKTPNKTKSIVKIENASPMTPSKAKAEAKKENASPMTPSKAKAEPKKGNASPMTPSNAKSATKKGKAPPITPSKAKAVMKKENASPITPSKAKAVIKKENDSPITPSIAKAVIKKENDSPITPSKAKSGVKKENAPLITPNKGKSGVKKENAPPITPNKGKSGVKKENAPPITPNKAKSGTTNTNASPKTAGKTRSSSLNSETVPDKVQSKKRKHEDSLVEEKSPKKLKEENSPKKKGKKATLVAANGFNEVDKVELLKAENERKHLQDLRTLYIRFKNKNAMKTEDDVMKIHPNIKHTRVFRSKRFRTKSKDPINFAFIEFESEEAAKKAHKDLSPKSDDFFVDFMGPNAKSKKLTNKTKNKESSKKMKKTATQINPLRLFVNGISSGITQSVLRELFPKASKAVIPDVKKKGCKKSKFAFLEFTNPLDAKAAFDASKNLEVNGHHITVLYARYEKKYSKTSTNQKDAPTQEVQNGIDKSQANDEETADAEDSESDVENDADDDDEME